MRFKLAILNVLAKSPGGRATFDEVRRGVRVIIASGDQREQLKRFSEFGDIDIFQSGLVLRDDAGLEITDAGLSLLHSLGSSSEPSLEFSSAPALQPLDDLSDTDERLKTFDLELAMPGNDAQDDERRTIEIETPDPTSKIGAFDLPASTNSKSRDRDRKSFGLASLAAVIAAKQKSILDIARRYLAQRDWHASNGKNERLVRNTGGAAFAVLSLVFVIACVVAAIAFGQIQSLKSDVAALRRELLPVKERVTKLEQIEKEKRDLDEPEETQTRADAEKNKPGAGNRLEPLARGNPADKRLHQAGSHCGRGCACHQCRRYRRRWNDSTAVATDGEDTEIARGKVYDPQWIDHHCETR